MDEFMNRLADLILLEMERRECSAAYFADICGISKNELGNIVRRKKKDIYVSTVLKICENSGISLGEILNYEEELNWDNFVLTNGKVKYALKKY